MTKIKHSKILEKSLTTVNVMSV